MSAPSFTLDIRAFAVLVVALAAGPAAGCMEMEYEEDGPPSVGSCEETLLVTYPVGKSTVCVGESVNVGAEARAPACASHRDVTTEAVFATSDPNVVICEKQGGPTAPVQNPAICRATGLGVATVHALRGTLHDDVGFQVTVERCEGEAGTTPADAGSI